MEKAKKKLSFLFLLVLGMVIGYVLTVYSLFPVHHGHIFAEAPIDLPYGKAPIAASAHLSLVHDKNPLSKQSWYYVLNAIDGQGKKVNGKKLSSEIVGGLFNLEASANLTWSDDAKSVTAHINDFAYTLKVD